MQAPITPTEQEIAQADNWLDYHPPTEEQKASYSIIRAQAKVLAFTLLENCPASADRTVALRKLRECVMTANASIACGGK